MGKEIELNSRTKEGFLRSRIDSGCHKSLGIHIWTDEGEGDKYFSKKPKSETVAQQLERQIRDKGGNQLSEIVGKWPGDETDEEFEQMLKELD